MRLDFQTNTLSPLRQRRRSTKNQQRNRCHNPKRAACSMYGPLGKDRCVGPVGEACPTLCQPALWTEVRTRLLSEGCAWVFSVGELGCKVENSGCRVQVSTFKV